MLTKPTTDTERAGMMVALNSLAAGELELADFKRMASSGWKDTQPEEPKEPTPAQEGDEGGAAEPQGGEEPEGEA